MAAEDAIESEKDAAPAALSLTIPEMWLRLSSLYPDLTAVVDPHNSPPASLTYAQLHAKISAFGAGLHALGLQRGDKVSLFSENSWRWLVADQGVMMNGGVDAVRGSTSPVEELGYILRHSDSVGLVVQDTATLDRLLPQLTGQGQAPGAQQPANGDTNGNGAAHTAPVDLRFVVVLWGAPSAAASAALACPALGFEQVCERGTQGMADGWEPVRPAGDSPATIVFTSGTTGYPKGVVLSHGNLAYQVSHLDHVLQLEAGKQALSLLPPWHIYERTSAYYILSRGCQLTYTNIRKFRDDLQAFPPDYFVCVPLVLDTLFNKVMATLRSASPVRRAVAGALMWASTRYVGAKRTVQGVNVAHARAPVPWHTLLGAAAMATLMSPLHRLAQSLVYGKVRSALGIREAVVSGGGSLAGHLDDFYESIGLPVLNGWGLTETSPVVACRRNVPGGNVRGSVGVPLPGTSVRVVDPETMQEVPDGRQGLLLVRGPGVMQGGYYKDPGATARAFPVGNGWFDTGDLGWRAPAGVQGSSMAGSIVLTGRAKDTIVLTSGKNVEPQPLEDAVAASPYVQVCVCVGHDHRALGALVSPNLQALEERAQEQGVERLSAEEVYQLLRSEINAALAGRAAHEHISEFVVLPQPLSPEDGTLTRTMKPRRPQIMDKYRPQLEQVLKKLR